MSQLWTTDGQRKSEDRRNSRQIRNHFLGCQTDIVSFALLVDLFEVGWGRVLAGSYLCHLVFPIDMSDVCCDNCALLILIDIPETYGQILFQIFNSMTLTQIWSNTDVPLDTLAPPPVPKTAPFIKLEVYISVFSYL